MSVDLIFRPPSAPAPVLDVDHPLDDAPAVEAPSQVGAGSLPQLVVAEVATDPVEALLLSVAGGDLDALVALQARMTGLVHLNVRRILRDASRAEAVTQSTFADLQPDASRFDPARCDAQTWLLTRAHQRAIDRLRSTESTDDPPGSLPTPAAARSLP